MRKFVATLNDASFINIAADRMEINENMVYVYDGGQLVALVDVSAIITAHISERREGE